MPRATIDRVVSKNTNELKTGVPRAFRIRGA